MPDLAELRRAVTDIRQFSKVICGAELWPHQVEVANSAARYRVICSGRQAGKSRLLAVMALHKAFTSPKCLVLIVSAGENAAQRVLADIAELCAAPLLRGSVMDETKSVLTLSTGSVIRSVPASQKQIRGWSADLLIVDEAALVDNDIWRATEPVIIARPGSRVVMASSPGGGPDHFFRQLWNRGTVSPDAAYQSWHWPSTISPLVDAVYLEEVRRREIPAYFNREYLAIWEDSEGTFFSEAEIMDCVADYDLLSPETVDGMCPWDRDAGRKLRPFGAVMGLDWAYSYDAQAAVTVAALDDGGLNGPDIVYYIPWLEYKYRCPYSEWVDRAEHTARLYGAKVIASEVNGVGAAPTETLRDRMLRAGTGCAVIPVWTDAKRKQAGYGKIKLLMQQGRLVLPREPELIKQLRSMEFTAMEGGSVRIAVPERQGHDDIAVAFMQAVSCIRPCSRGYDEIPERFGVAHTTNGAGVKVPLQARPVEWHMSSYAFPRGKERTIEAAW